MALVAALPILFALGLLVGLRWPAARAMPLCAAATAGVALWTWRVAPIRVAAAAVEAVWIAASILLIVFGALFLLALMRRTGAIATLQRTFAGISGDARVQAVLVGWVLGSFIEGAAGFGTPAAITAPLLIGLGFPPAQAVVVALVGDSTAVSFGAVGTPMVVGMGQGLADQPGAPAVAEIARQVALYDLALGTLMPVVLVLALTLATAGRAGWRLGWRAAPFAAAVGAAQASAAAAAAWLLGPELPSLAGPLVALAVAALLLRRGWLAPRVVWTLPPAPADEASPVEAPAMGPLRAFAPYLLLVALLVLTRVRALPIGEWLAGVEVGMRDIFATDISARLQPLYSPGAVFLACALLSAPLLRARARDLGAVVGDAARVTAKTAVALVAAIATVRVFIRSDVNAAGLDAMPLVLADTLAAGLGDVWPPVAPWIGALGAFIAGSATFSNMLFALFQYRVAEAAGFGATAILGLQSVGAAAGNMVCVHNVVAACAVAGILGQEGRIIRRTALPMAVYLLVAGLLGAVVAPRG